ncbi:PAS domain S-box protein [Isosphaeraceae bacterium EP7]
MSWPSQGSGPFSVPPRGEASRLEESGRLALVARHTDNAVLITDRDRRIEWCNDAFTRLSGYTLDEILGRTPGSFLQGTSTDPEIVNAMRTRLGQGLGFRVELVNTRKQGGSYWVELEVEPARGATGEVTHFIAIQRDISGRKHKERRDEVRHECLRVLSGPVAADGALPRLLDVIGEGLGLFRGEYWEVDGAANVLRLARGWSSNGLAAQLGSSTTSAMLLPLGKGLPGEAWAGSRFVRHAVTPRALAADGDPEPGTGTPIEPSFAFPVRGEGPVMGVMRFFGRPAIEDDANLVELVGRLGRKIGYFLERIKAEQRLREAEERSRVILETSVDGILTLNMLGRIETANPSALALFGYEAAELLGREVGMLIPGLPWFGSSPESAQGEAGQWGVRRFQARRKDGTEIQIELSVSKFRLAGRSMFTYMIRDVRKCHWAASPLGNIEECFQAFMARMSVAAWICDLEGNLAFRSPSIERAGGPDFPAGVGENILDASPVRFSEAYAESILRASRSDGADRIVEDAPRLDGSSGRFVLETFALPHEQFRPPMVGTIVVALSDRAPQGVSTEPARCAALSIN